MEWHRIAYFVPMVPLRTYSLTHSATKVTSQDPLMALSGVWLLPTTRTSPPPSNEVRPKSPSNSLALYWAAANLGPPES